MTPAPYYLTAASRDDLDALVLLERRCFTHPWSVRNFREALGDPHRGGVLVLRERPDPGDPIVGLLAYCCIQVVLDELHIHNLAVRPERRAQGLGRRLLELVLALGVRRGAEVCLLEVRQSNEAALALYRSLGFQATGLRRNYYERPREDALLLRKIGLMRAG